MFSFFLCLSACSLAPPTCDTSHAPSDSSSMLPFLHLFLVSCLSLVLLPLFVFFVFLSYFLPITPPLLLLLSTFSSSTSFLSSFPSSSSLIPTLPPPPRPLFLPSGMQPSVACGDLAVSVVYAAFTPPVCSTQKVKDKVLWWT